MNLKNMITRLTSNYNKAENSNVYKLFSIFAPEIEFLKELLLKIESWRGIKNARGTTLDLIGEDLRQERLGLSDEEYRPMLRFKSSINKSDTDINSVNTAINSITNNEFLRICEGYNYQGLNEPASIVISLKDFDKNINYEMINNVLAAGVRAYIEVVKENEGIIYIAPCMVYGETVTIYPYNIKIIENRVPVNIGIGYNTSYEIIEIFPKK